MTTPKRASKKTAPKKPATPAKKPSRAAKKSPAKKSTATGAKATERTGGISTPSPADLLPTQGAAATETQFTTTRGNGDETHQGRHLRLVPGEFSMQRIALYRYR